MSRPRARNVLGEPLADCSHAPLTGWFRDRWCLCAARWHEAEQAGAAPRVVLAATHEATLAVVPLAALKRHAIDLS